MVGSIDPLFHFVASHTLGYGSSPTAHKMLAMRQTERKFLNDLRQILLATDMDIPSSHVETIKQSFIALYNTVRTGPLIGMSYPLLGVLNVVDLLKYWHMKYDADVSSQPSSSQTGS